MIAKIISVQSQRAVIGKDQKGDPIFSDPVTDLLIELPNGNQETVRVSEEDRKKLFAALLNKTVEEMDQWYKSLLPSDPQSDPRTFM